MRDVNACELPCFPLRNNDIDCDLAALTQDGGNNQEALMFYGELLAVWNEGNSWFVLDLAASTRDSDA